MNPLRLCQSLATAGGNAPTTSAKPPVFAEGVHSDAANTIYILRPLSAAQATTGLPHAPCSAQPLVYTILLVIGCSFPLSRTPDTIFSWTTPHAPPSPTLRATS